MQDIKNSTVEDYDPEKVLNLDEDNTTNFAVFGENTLILDDTSADLTEVDEDTYVFQNANDEIRSLKQGDYFAFLGANDQLILAKIGEISVDGTTVTVRSDSSADLEEIFDVIKIDAESDGDSATFDDSDMVLFQPRQEQHYEYFGKDKTEVYWVHFTGSNVKNILRRYDIPLDTPVFYSGTSAIYAYLFEEMINELQTCRTGYEELLTMYLQQILILVQRIRLERRPSVNTHIQEEMEYARRYFNEHYNEQINIEEYAESRNMSVSWFQRNFKQIVNCSPMQYLLTIRMNNAASLLESTDYSMAEISTIVGYDNPLYFSRLFKKQNRVSPSEYRKLVSRKG